MERHLIINQLPPLAKYYPKPKVSMLPILDSKTLTCRKSAKKLSHFANGNTLKVPSGRVALYYALKKAGISKGDCVLVPAYHCGSMIEPILWLEATPIFFHLDHQLLVTNEELERRKNNKVKAVLLTHFFGFPQPISMVKAFCKKNGLKLIEDCAHSYFSRIGEVKMGQMGDYSIASTVKFFTGTEGGLLIDNQHQSETKLAKPTIALQLKHIKNFLEQAADYGRLGFFGRLLNKLSGTTTKNESDQQRLSLIDQYPSTTDGTDILHKHNLIWFNHKQIGLQPTLVNRFVWRHTDSNQVVEQRIANYQHYVKRLAQVNNINFLHSTLDAGVIPYIFPLILENPSKHFPILKMLGVPIWRWEELVVSDCPVSENYRLRLIQLPCHQSLSQTELDWIIDTIIKTVEED